MYEYLHSDNIVPRPYRNQHPDILLWLDEQIWGHRLLDQQSPWLLFLEFLTVAEACLREKNLFNEGGVYYPLQFFPYRRLDLRNLLFNNEFVTQIGDQHSDSSNAWEKWCQEMAEQAQGIGNRDFSYLKDQLSTLSFHEFATIITTLRSTAVESDTNRRWSSRFVFPFGPDGLYEDLNIRAGRTSREYINFGRTGELLYLMLCRSKSVMNLSKSLVLLLDENRPLNMLLKRLQPEQRAYNTDDRQSCYLPYKSHPRFDLLGEDWEHIFALELPEYDAYQYLVPLSAFHIMLYQLNTATGFIPDSSEVHFICEVIAPRKTQVRELSISNYHQNSNLTEQAIDAYVSSKIIQSVRWKEAIAKPASEEAFITCKEILKQKVWWGDSYEGPRHPDRLLKELKETGKKRHRQHAGNIHRTYGQKIGLISSRSTNRLRYAPNDTFLKTLLVTNVKRRMELNEFLERLYRRYGLVFGAREASVVLPVEEFDQKAFQANTERLERRLSSMGMLRRLSDACAYVTNPFARDKNDNS